MLIYITWNQCLEEKENVFTWAGKIILWLLGILLILAWGLAAKLPPIYMIASIGGLSSAASLLMGQQFPEKPKIQ
jgi:hypothetical protein